MQPDPLGLAAGKNPFNYVNQNPLNWTDPEGLSPYGLTNGSHGTEWNLSISSHDNPVRQVWDAGTRSAKNVRGPDYVALSSNFYVYNIGLAINLRNGNTYLQTSLATRSFPNYSYKPSACMVFGNVLASDVDADRVDGFLNKAASQVSVFTALGNPFIGVGGALSYSYGGDLAIEYGFGTPGVGVSPVTYGKRIK